MAHPLSQILPEAPVVPHQVSPVMRDGYRRRMVGVLIGTGVLWFLIFGSLAFVSVPMLIELDGSVFAMITELTGEDSNAAATVFMLLILVGVPLVLGASFALKWIGRYFRLWAGYRVHNTIEGKDTPGLRWLATVPLALGAIGGLVAAAAGSVVRGEIWAALAWAAVAILVGYLTGHIGQRAIAVVNRCRTRWSQQEQIIARGRHTVAWVEKMDYTGDSIGGRSEFIVHLACDHGGERSLIKARVFEYPIWAPIRGTEFDVWTTDDLPLDVSNADRIIVERRYVGRNGPPDPEMYRRSSSDHRQRVAPKWVTPKVDGTTREVRGARGWLFLQWFALGIRILGTLLSVALFVAVVVNGGWLSFVTYLALCVVSVADTGLAIARLGRARWYIRNRFPSWMVILMWMGWPVLAIPSLISDPALYCCGQEGDFSEVGIIGFISTFVLMGLSFVLAAMAFYPPVLFNRGFEAPAEAMQQAMTSHDPSLADRLEAETGVRVGIALVQDDPATALGRIGRPSPAESTPSPITTRSA
ncbi:hypothetical protein FB566_2312 [Stackebrandtia endophytica]|uniref:Uncharacterized protein n=1 Tax=Stackebrandtia endophytica TaxID=1496996 RepID=A0A543AW13_9ACTN|nr:hypothetical protein [Stackebrandtia endophytica]TQL76775.1 hypothetical protein FB566_2312 [Stackebrandtia endophytica]